MGITSRERILMALEHKETDRVPIDLGSSRSTGINAIAYKNLCRHLEIEKETVLFDVKQLLALPDHEVLRRLGCDVVILPRLVPSIGIPIDKYKMGDSYRRRFTGNFLSPGMRRSMRRSGEKEKISIFPCIAAAVSIL